jgi:phage gp46-like protein
MSLNGDIAVIQGDFQLVQNDLTSDEGLETAVAMSLFLDRRADDSDQLPATHTDARGWWADEFPPVPGDLIGSRLWLLARETNTASVLQRANQYTKEALQWFIDDGVASEVNVTVTNPSGSQLVIAVSITRPGSSQATSFLYNYNWAEQLAQGF